MSNFKYTRSNSSLERLVNALNKETSTFQEDTRFWKPVLDKTGNGYAVIRFLPAPPQDGEDGLPWVKLWTHQFKGPTGRYYIENSRTTLGPSEQDPVSILNSALWNSTEDDDSDERKQARAQKRKLVYISNILVVNDPKNPENNGKVFLYRYGVKIRAKIDAKMKPQVEGKAGVNVFDPFAGANFELQVKQVKNFPNYDDSQFEAVSAIAKDEDEFERIWNQQHSLAQFVAPDQFKSFDDLQKKLNSVLGVDENSRALASAKPTKARTVEDEDNQRAPKAATPPWQEDEDEDEDLARFRQKAKLLDDE